MRSFVGKIILLGFLVTLGCGASKIGLDKNGLRPCPDSPNCVVSVGGDEDHSIPPILYSSDRALAMQKLKSIVSGMRGTRVITQTSDYLHVEFRSRVMKFVDDVEFWFPQGQNLIHVRSASRLGYSDFGVNRERIEKIRSFWDGDGTTDD